MQTTNAKKFQLGIESAIKKLHATLFVQQIQLKKFASDKFVKRINSFFTPDSQTQKLFWFYLDKINNLYDRESLEELVLKLSS